MFHFCLDLGVDGPVATLAVLALLVPWLLTVAYWTLSFVLYDSSILMGSIIFNYALYGVLFFVASAWGIESPRALPCEGLPSVFFDIYRYMWPSPLLITLCAYLFFLITRHTERSDHWWPGFLRMSKPRRFLATLNIVLPIIYLLASLWYLEISTIPFLLANIALGIAFSVALTVFLWANAWWQGCGQALDLSFGWDHPATQP